jgi:hypothetical protein
MPTLTINYSLDLIESFIDRINSANGSYYFYIGRPTPWVYANGIYSDTVIPAANDTIHQRELELYKDLSFGKLIKPNDVMRMIKRNDWVANTVYARYDPSDNDMYNKAFYVITDTLNVYKCIDNNYEAPSTVKPTVISSDGVFYTTDGYVWKYMYTVSSTNDSKFSTLNYIPIVPNANVIANSISSTVDVIDLTSYGNNYNGYYRGYVQSAINNSVILLDSNASSYDNFYVGSSIYLQSGLGAGQLRRIDAYDGRNNLLRVSEPFDSHIIMSIGDITGTASIGDYMTQNVDTASIFYTQGIFQVGDTIAQSDGSAYGTITTANSTTLSVVRGSDSNFIIGTPIYNTVQSGVLAAGLVSCQPFAVITTASNTGSFTTGETVYQSNGSANIAVGSLFSVTDADIAGHYTLTVGVITGAFTNSYQLKGVSSGSNAAFTVITSNNSGMSYIWSTNTAQTSFASTYTVNSYVRLGSNVAVDVRRVVAVNSSSLTVATPVSQTYMSSVYYKSLYAAELASYTNQYIDGYVIDTNLNAVKLQYTNASVLGLSFIPGENIDMVDSHGINQGTSGTVSYSNSSVLIVSDVLGSGFLSAMYLHGQSSQQTALIESIITYPTLTVNSSASAYSMQRSGQNIYLRDPTNFNTIKGYAEVLSAYAVPSDLTEYIISPSVTIVGDGVGALAYSTVNTSSGASNSIANVIVINSGSNYTFANIEITSNSIHGSGATAIASVSPIAGHGADAYSELNARYVSITIDVGNSYLESYTLPTYGYYRKIGIIDSPFYNNIHFTLNNFDRVKLLLSNVSVNSFSSGEIVYQPNSSSAGIVVFANSTYLELNSVRGTFSANGLFANLSIANDSIIGLTSGTLSNVSAANISNFTLISNNQIVYNTNTGATAVLMEVSDSNVYVTNAVGRFYAGDVLYDPSTNAYASIYKIYESNGALDVTTVYGEYFTQLMRFPLTSNTGHFQLFETITQDTSLAFGTIVGGSVTVPSSATVSVGNDIDLSLTGSSGTFTVGDIVTNAGNTCSAIVAWSNTTYIKLISVSGTFSNNIVINNSLGTSAIINAIYPVIIMADVSGIFSSGTLSGNVVGSVSNSYGRCDIKNALVYPTLVKNSGDAIYLDNIAPFNISNASSERMNLILKF